MKMIPIKKADFSSILQSFQDAKKQANESFHTVYVCGIFSVNDIQRVQEVIHLEPTTRTYFDKDRYYCEFLVPHNIFIADN